MHKKFSMFINIVKFCAFHYFTSLLLTKASYIRYVFLWCVCLFAEYMRALRASAVTLLDNELFALPEPSAGNLNVYDAGDYMSHGTISIPVFSCNFVDMAACCFYHCLYLANAFTPNTCIVRLQMPSKLSTWEVSDMNSETTVAVTSSHHLLVVCGTGSSKSLKLFSTDGVLHKTVKLQPDLVNLNSVAELMPGHYVITRGRHSSDLHQVCVINSEGKVLHAYGGFQGSYQTLMNTPVEAAIDKDGFVYVVEANGSRLIVLTKELDYVHCINLHADYLKSRPRLKIDNETRRLYVRHVSEDRWSTTYNVSVFEIEI